MKSLALKTLDLITECVFIFDDKEGKNKIVYANNSFVKAYKSDPIGKSLLAILKNDPTISLKSIIKQKGRISLDLSGQKTDFMLTAVFNKKGDSCRYIATQQKQSQTRELEIKTSEIQFVQSLLKNVSSSFSHEIRNPLTTISNTNSFFAFSAEKNKPIPNEDTMKMTKRIEAMIFRISRMIKGVSSVLRSDAKEKQAELSLLEVISPIMDIVQYQANNKGVELTIESVPSVNVICQPGQIQQLFLSLISHSVGCIENQPEKWIKISFKFENDGFLKIKLADSCKNKCGWKDLSEAAQRIMLTSKGFIEFPTNQNSVLTLSIQCSPNAQVAA